MSVIKTNPAVFVVGDTYQIMVPVTCEALMWVKVGDNSYYDHSNGILRSHVTTHRIVVPMNELDSAKEYSIHYRKIIDRKPYFPETEDEVTISYKFYPVPCDNARGYQIADAHNLVDAPVWAAKKFEEVYGKINFLILNGDVPDHSGEIENFDNIYEIVSKITNGNIPTVFSRGNHDTRGLYAENIAEHTPCQNGNSYFSFRLGKIWGIVLDCGEDKDDSHAEYGHTICCKFFRNEETKYLEKIIENEKYEYAADDVKYKMVVCHNPFTKKYEPPFNIEEDTFGYWTKLLSEKVKPDVMMCGHIHALEFYEKGGEYDAYGQPCDVVVGSRVNRSENYFAGAGIILNDGKITVVFNDDEKIIEEKVL